MLFGRVREREQLDQLLEAARAGRGGALVLLGEPGIGKTALAEATIAAAHDFQVLRTIGSEAEMELAFAAAQQLCAPRLAHLDDLPEPQRDALLVAFGHKSGPAPDRLLVGIAVLNLLAQLAGERPVLCAVDDAQWLDRESAQALAFAARRVSTESVAFLFGARTTPTEVRGLPSLVVEGLAPSAALALVRSVLPDRLDETVLERIVAECHGNPLALLELPRGLSPAQLAGGFALPVTVPMTGRIEASFRRRFLTLPPPSRRLLLIAAAEPTGDPALVWRAADLLDVKESAAAAAEEEELVDLHPRVVFRHPLVRSAIYRSAAPEDRRDAHRALADATDASLDPDRRAWHRAQAAVRPDDDVAADLELSATRAQARGGFAAAAAFLERSAELTVDPPRRARRALAAAEAKRQVGALDAALALAAIAGRGPLDDAQRAQLDVLRGRVSFASQRGSDAPLLLLQAARRLEPQDPTDARDTYLDAITAALFAGRLAHRINARDVAKAALSAAPSHGRPRAADLLLDGLARLIAEGPSSGAGVLRQALDAFRGDTVAPDERLRWTWLAGRAAAFIWDYDSWDLLVDRQVRVARDAGALTVLPLTLSTRAGVHMFAGELATAASLAEQLEAVADAIDTRNAAYAAVALAAFRGREKEACATFDASADDFRTRGEGMGVTLVSWAYAALYNGLRRYDDAYESAQGALQDPDELWFWPWATVELIEAASRTGRAAAANPALERLAELTSAGGALWGTAIEARSRALLSEGARAEELYRAAIERLEPSRLRVDLARTRLVYGEWLRRGRRHVDARDQLRQAHDLFTDFGMEGYAERARIELRATGEKARKRSVDTSNELTPQETQIAQLVAEGAANAEIAAQMFISPSTVEYHLRKVFRKVGVKSRTQLARHVLDTTADRAHLEDPARQG
jgi:DNA-binding CsgD family transcriptional regulator